MKNTLDEMPNDLRQQVADFAEFPLAKAHKQACHEDAWASLVSSIERFSDEYMAGRDRQLVSRPSSRTLIAGAEARTRKPCARRDDRPVTPQETHN